MCRPTREALRTFVSFVSFVVDSSSNWQPRPPGDDSLDLGAIRVGHEQRGVVLARLFQQRRDLVAARLAAQERERARLSNTGATVWFARNCSGQPPMNANGREWARKEGAGVRAALFNSREFA